MVCEVREFAIDYDIDMDPYEPLPIDTDTAGAKKPWLQWKAIGIAFLLQLAVSIFLNTLFSSATRMPELIFFSICFGIPYVCGAACLSHLVKSNWILHGLIYALICPILFFSLWLASELSSIVICIVWELFTILLTLATMAFTRMLMANHAE